MLNLAVIHEAIAEAIAERECLVDRDRRLTWAQVTDRSRRLADLLRAHGLGCRRGRAELESWDGNMAIAKVLSPFIKKLVRGEYA